MTLYFAYGSNMSRRHMGALCPDARACGPATLAGWRFVISPDGYASIASQPGGTVHGVLWQLAARDLAALNAYENVPGGLYRRRVLPVQQAGRRVAAVMYVAARHGTGTPRPGYIAQVVEAARDWALPQPYVRAIGRWSPSALAGARSKDVGEVA